MIYGDFPQLTVFLILVPGFFIAILLLVVLAKINIALDIYIKQNRN